MTEPTHAPLIVTLALDLESQARFDRLRAAHFPPERNVLDAHLTLFHYLPGAEEAAVAACLAEHAAATAPFLVRVAGLRSLGRGVAFTLASPDLVALRAALARRWLPRLTAQDRQGFRPHVTVQNKVDPARAAALLRDLSVGFAPWDVVAEGLSLWRYRGGPWDPAGTFPFTAGAAGQD